MTVAPRIGNPGIGGGLNTQGMIAPNTLFVEQSGVLNATSFRFLFNLLLQINALEAKVGTLQATVTSLQERAAPPTQGTP